MNLQFNFQFKWSIYSIGFCWDVEIAEFLLIWNWYSLICRDVMLGWSAGNYAWKNEMMKLKSVGEKRKCCMQFNVFFGRFDWIKREMIGMVDARSVPVQGVVDVSVSLKFPNLQGCKPTNFYPVYSPLIIGREGFECILKPQFTGGCTSPFIFISFPLLHLIAL